MRYIGGREDGIRSPKKNIWEKKVIFQHKNNGVFDIGRGIRPDASTVAAEVICLSNG